MDHIRAIQEVVDEHKESMPTCVVTRVMDQYQCQKAYEATKLYKLTWTMVDSHAHVVEVEDEPDVASVKLSHKTQTLIVEKVDRLPDHPNGHGGKISTMEMPNHGMVIDGWIDHFINQPLIPLVMMPCDGMPYGATSYMVIVNSIVPYEPRKRAREDTM